MRHHARGHLDISARRSRGSTFQLAFNPLCILSHCVIRSVCGSSSVAVVPPPRRRDDRLSRHAGRQLATLPDREAPRVWELLQPPDGGTAHRLQAPHRTGTNRPSFPQPFLHTPAQKSNLWMWNMLHEKTPHSNVQMNGSMLVKNRLYRGLFRIISYEAV